MQQATDELQKVDLGDFEIPKEIQDREYEGYVCICIQSKDNAQGTGKVHTARLAYAPVDKWEQMKKEVAKKRVSGMFGGMFSMVVILNNPTLRDVVKKEYVPKPLTDEQKAAAQELYNTGMTLRPMAQQMDIKEKDLKPYFESLKNN